MIKTLKLTNIRSFKKSEFEFQEGANLIVGNNGSGKTTILESIGLLGFGKYLSMAQDSFVIRAGEEAGRIEAMVKLEDYTDVEIGFAKKEKLIKINGVKSPVSNLIGLQPQVFFNPQTVELVFDAPALRRQELDMVLVQSDHQFVLDILAFKKILKERNALLRMLAQNRSKLNELEFWDRRFCEYALKIYRKRKDLLDFYNQTIGEIFSSLMNGKYELKLKYAPSCDYDRLEEVLSAHLESDLESGSTGVGPHRDDFGFYLDGKMMRLGASRGEQRLAAVAFKACSSEFLTREGMDPVIVLDDVFSELDHSRQEAVSSSLGLFKVSQVFISATNLEAVPVALRDKSNIINITK